MTTRQDIAGMLSTVDGVTGYAFRPDSVNVGDAWPLLSGYDRNGEKLPAMTFYRVWRIVVALPADEQSASSFIDDHAPDLVEALIPVGYVDSMVPAELGTSGAATSYGMMITLRGES